MKFKVIGRYKSIKDFSSEDLPPFTVIIGKNGSGKTQLTKMLAGQTENSNEFKIEFNEPLKRVQFEGLDHKGLGMMMDSSWSALISRIHNTYINFAHAAKLFIHEALINDSGFNIDKIDLLSFNKILSHLSKKEINDLRFDMISQINSKARKEPSKIADKYIRNYLRNNSKEISEFISISKQVDKDLDMLQLEDFHKSFFDYSVFDNQQLFGYNLEGVFLSYIKTRDLNDRAFFNKKNYGYANSSISRIEFSEKNSSPWKLINQILKEHRINYFFEEPHDDINLYLNFQYPIVFKKSDTNEDISFQDLSSGEKIIIGLILKLFIKNFSKGQLRAPDLLILDEPDAHLHPEMAKLLVDVLNDTFVKELGVKVIVTTHSPSTVAIVPDNSIYELRNSPNCSLKQVAKDNALKMLTSGIPTLSIDYNNRRQIFVESNNDAFFYDKLYQKLKPYLTSEVSLNFISSGVGGKGDCEQVKNVVNELRDNGNKSVFGLIDWDLKNNGNRFIKVLGRNSRYSIENYIFDPVLVSAFLLREKIIDRKEFGLYANETYSDLKNFSNDRLQSVCDLLIQKLSNNFSSKTNELVRSKYLNGIELQLPKWYLVCQGHELEKQLKTSFIQLRKFKAEGALKNEMLLKVIDDVPELISIDILDVFKEIQTI